MDDTVPQVRSAIPKGIAPGTALGRYVMLDRVGAGGMGVVYAAYDPELDRRIALKLMHPGPDRDGGGRARLLREAQAMARLVHPNVVTVHDAGTVDDQVFVAMEFVDGTTLGSWLAERPRGWREALAPLIAAGRGLAAAHAAGLVHRDFKPDNVMLARDGRVLVMDFGLARSAEGAPAPSETPSELRRPPVGGVTVTGAVLGTPAYMAPEQHLGQAAGAPADQFAYCVSLYEALHGARPFVAGDGVTDVPAAVAVGVEILSGRVRPGPRDASLPARLRRAVARGLADDPAARWPSMTALLAELDAIARPRRRGLVAGGAAVLLAVAGVTFVLARDRTVAAPSPCLGAAARSGGVWDATAQARLARGFRASGSPVAEASLAATSRRLDAYFTGWVAQRTEACEATQRGEQSAELLDLRMSCLDERFAEAGALVEILATADASIVNRSVAATGALSPLAACADRAALTAPLPPPRDPTVRAAVEAVRARLARVRALRSTGSWKLALLAIRTIAAEALALRHDPLVAEALHEQANLEAKTGEVAAAEADFERAAAAADRGRHDLFRAKAYVSLIHVTGTLGRRPTDAHRHARLAASVIARLGDPPALRADLLEQEGTVYAASEPARALPMLVEALALRERVHGADDPETAMTRLNLGLAYYQQNDYPAARAQLDRARAQLEGGLGADHPLVAHALLNLGNVAAQQKQLDEAQGYYQQALGIRERLLGPDSPELGGLVHNLAYIMQARGQWQPSVAVERRALALMERKYGAGNPIVASPLTGIGEALVELGDFAGAIAPLERAASLRAGEGSNPSDRSRTAFALARALWDGGGDRRRARGLAEDARAGWAATNEGEGTTRAAAWLAAHPR